MYRLFLFLMLGPVATHVLQGCMTLTQELPQLKDVALLAAVSVSMATNKPGGYGTSSHIEAQSAQHNSQSHNQLSIPVSHLAIMFPEACVLSNAPCNTVRTLDQESISQRQEEANELWVQADVCQAELDSALHLDAKNILNRMHKAFPFFFLAYARESTVRQAPG
jgi:hypothetical protein